jgi:hydroxymethylbilane synthase
MIATSSTRRTLKLGTRGSLLARMQSRWIADQLQRRHPRLKVQLVVCRTTGDRVVDRPLHDLGGKGLFTKELEEALLDDRVDLVVHSMKDVPVTMPLVDASALTIAAVPWRADARDVLVARDRQTLRQLMEGATVATGSLRRRCQLLTLRPDLIVRPLRGNIDTRLAHVERGTFDAVVLAVAGVRRANLFDPETMSVIPTDDLLPAAGQGALAVQCRADDTETRKLAAVLNDARTRTCVDLERAIVRELDGDCRSPIAAYAEIEQDDVVRVRAVVGGRGGEPYIVRAEARAKLARAHDAVGDVIRSLNEQHAQDLLSAAEANAA